MTDSVQVFPPGFVVTHEGEPVDGYIQFKNAAYSGTRTVYSTSDLSTTSLGSTVYLSNGIPVASEGSNTPVMVYIGSVAYSIIIKDNDDLTLLSLDNIKGALDTSTFLTTGSTSTLDIPVVATAINLTLAASHNGKLINATSSPTLTLTAAATLGDGWSVKIRNGGSGQVGITASQAIALPMGSATSFALRPGEGCSIFCDGAAFKASEFSPPLLSGTVGVIVITDRVSAAPSSPTAGDRYIVTAAYSTFEQEDIIEADGQGGFIEITPAADCGWLAYVQDEDTLYQFQGSAWVCLTATSAQAIAGTNNAAFMTSLSTRATVPARNYAEYVTSADITTVLPYDDTIPQNTEGVEVLSAAITPKAVTSRIRVTFQAVAGTSGAGTIFAVAALFQDSVASALHAASLLASAGNCQTLGFQFEHCPATTSAVTYKVRAGPGSAGTLRLNGEYNARKFGGVAHSTLLVEEVVL